MAGINERVLGRCDHCGGEVTVPKTFMSTQQPVPKCCKCDREIAMGGPPIKMKRSWAPRVPVRVSGID